MITIAKLHSMKQNNQKITCLTAYDATFARLLSEVGTDILLVGDSLGNTIQGHSDTIPVTMEAMCYHTQCVKAGNQSAFLMADLPFLSYAQIPQTLENAGRLMQAGAQMVKLEGGGPWLYESVQALVERGIPVCGHLGLTPQSVHQLGGYKVQGRSEEKAQAILQAAIALEKAGAQLLVLECVPLELAKIITETISIPTIGIGAGPHCDGQVLVLYDMLGLSPGKPFSFVHNFMQEQTTVQAAITAYNTAVRDVSFPRLEHSFRE